jgi:signal peptide peptidase SppA
MVQSFVNEPVMFDGSKADALSATLNHLSSDPEALAMLNERMGSMDDFWQRDEHPYRPYIVQNGVLQIPVQGVLINRLGYQLGSWATGYRYIEAALIRGMNDPEVKGIALVINSGGGQVAGCFELVDYIHSLRGMKPIRAYSADAAYSAAYAIASAADSISVTRSGGTGSIGVMTAHMDVSENMARNGIKLTMIFAGSHKVDGNSYEKLPESVKARMQERIDRTYDVFTSTVARNRGMEESAVKATEALLYDAQDSIAVGLADKVGSLDEEMVTFEDDMAELEDEQMSITQEQMDAAVAKARLEGVTEGKAQGVSEGTTAGATAERDRVNAILGSEEAKTRPAAALMMVDLGVDADKASAQMAKLPEEAKASTEAPKTEAAKSGFELAMQNGNPNVGANTEGDEGKEKMSVVDGIFASVGHGPNAKH